VKTLFGGQMIPAWILDVSFWMAIGAIVVVGVILLFLAGFGLHMITFRGGREKLADPQLAQLPREAYRLNELRELMDRLFFKLYGKPVDDDTLFRIYRALGRAKVSYFERVVMQSLPHPAFGDATVFISLACRAALEAEASISGRTLYSSDIVELQDLLNQEPVNRS